MTVQRTPQCRSAVRRVQKKKKTPNPKILVMIKGKTKTTDSKILMAINRKVKTTTTPLSKKPDLQDALLEYKRSFPSGHIFVETSRENLLCGFADVINTIASMH